MRTLFGVLLLLFIVASITIVVSRNPGYVLITREPYVLETSLAMFLILSTAIFTALYFFVRLLVRIVRVPHSLTRWRQTRRTRKAREAFLSGLKQLFAGQWLEAEKELIASLRATDSPYLAYLAAALAAQQQGDIDKRDGYLSQAAQLSGVDSLATDMTHAQLQLFAGQNEQALATLTRIQESHPQQAHTVRLLIEAHRRLREWHRLADLLPEARRRHLLPDEELDGIERMTQRELLSLPLPAGSLDTLHRAWSEVSESTRQHPDMIYVYARQLIDQNAMDECTALLAKSLNRQWDERLVQLYGQADNAQPAAQLETAEDWLAHHGESPALLLTLGRLARRNRLTDRAREYLEKSIRMGATAEAHTELGLLLEEAGDSAQAMLHCQQALVLCRKQLQPLPSSASQPVSASSRTLDYGY